MRLAELEPEFVRFLEPDSPGGGARGALQPVTAVDDAQGVWFLCPKCYAKNAGPIGTHRVLVWFKGRGVPDDATPGPGRWGANGSTFEDLTLTPSISLTNGCEWHGFVTLGDVTV